MQSDFLKEQEDFEARAARESKDMMASLLNSFDDLDNTPRGMQPISEPDFSEIDNLITRTGVYSASQEPTNAIIKHEPIKEVKFKILEQNLGDLKSIINYSVVIAETNQVIISNIYLKECAIVVRDFLNAGKPISDVKVLGIISTAIQYTTLINEVRRVSSSRQQVLREMDYESAKKYDIKLSELHEQALQIKERSIKFLTENGY